MIISVDNFFNFVNLMARGAIVVYLIKRYVISGVQGSMKAEKLDLKYLEQQHDQLQKACQKIEAQILQDKKTLALLQAKFKIWNQQEDEIIAQKQAACAQRQKNIEYAYLKKTKYLEHKRSIQIEVPKLLQDVSRKLQDTFAQNATLGIKYQEKVLQALEKLQ